VSSYIMFCIGLGLLAAGITIRVDMGHFEIVSLGFVIIGLIIVLLFYIPFYRAVTHWIK
jgi:hypothetical protein